MKLKRLWLVILIGGLAVVLRAPAPWRGLTGLLLGITPISGARPPMAPVTGSMDSVRAGITATPTAGRPQPAAPQPVESPQRLRPESSGCLGTASGYGQDHNPNPAAPTVPYITPPLNLPFLDRPDKAHLKFCVQAGHSLPLPVSRPRTRLEPPWFMAIGRRAGKRSASRLTDLKVSRHPEFLPQIAS